MQRLGADPRNLPLARETFGSPPRERKSVENGGACPGRSKSSVRFRLTTVPDVLPANRK